MSSTDLDPQGLAGRIEELLEGITADGGPAVGHAAEELVRVLMRFYGTGLEQMVSIVRVGAGDTIVHRWWPRCWPCTTCTRCRWSNGWDTRWTPPAAAWGRTAPA